MDHKLLFIDDEPSLLRGIERRLSFDFELDTAESGREGLQRIKDSGPYSVIFTDMRMPQMDGLQFLDRAREVAPDSVYLMLTGNNDQATAIRALNEGRVFRFLNKPCESGELKRAVRDSIHQYELVRGEKELLQKTFVGAVKVLTDVVDLTQPELAGRGGSIEKRLLGLLETLEVEPRWEFSLAGRLSLIGFALISDSDRLRFERTDLNTEVSSRIHTRCADITAKLLGDIPRLDIVSRICGLSSHAEGKTFSQFSGDPDALAETGASLLRAATLWDCLARQAVAPEEIARQIGTLMPKLPLVLIDAIESAPQGELEPQTISLHVDALEEGMVVGEDLVTGEGAVLVRRGRRLCGAAIEKLKSYQDLGAIHITADSAGAVPVL